MIKDSFKEHVKSDACKGCDFVGADGRGCLKEEGSCKPFIIAMVMAKHLDNIVGTLSEITGLSESGIGSTGDIVHVETVIPYRYMNGS